MIGVYFDIQTIGLLYILLALPIAGVGYGAWKNREKPTANGLMWSMIAGVGWTVVYGWGLVVSNPEITQATVMLRIVFASLATFFWLYVAVEYADVEWLKKAPVLTLFASVPVLDFVLGVTNQWHNLVFSSESSFGGTGLSDLVFGPWFFVHVVASYLMALLALSIYVLQFKDRGGAYRRQAGTLIVGTILVFVGSALFATGVSPIDSTPPFMAVGGFLVLVALFRFDLLEVSPVARKTLLENMEDAVVAVNEQDRIVDVNPQMRAVFDLDEDALGAPLQDALAPYSELAEAIERPDHEGEVTVSRNGEQRHFDVNVSRVSETTARFGVGQSRERHLGRTVVVRDITEQKHRERELERSRSLLQRTEELATVGGWEYDVTADSVRWTDGMYSICGLPESFEIQPDTVLNLWDQPDREVVEDAITRAIVETEPFKHEGRITTPEGNSKWVTIYGKPTVDDSDGRVTAVRGALRDVTVEKRRQQELERQNEQLDQFASFVSHDLRNPLGIAQTYVDFARDTGGEDDFDAVEEALDRMDEMIDDLLAFARSGGTVEETQPVSLEETASAAWKNVKTGDATITLPEDDVEFDADPERIMNVFENCLRNSVEHGSTGNRTGFDDQPISVRVVPTVSADGRTTGFAIEDDGPGIPEAERETVLEHGYSTREDGTGFGLSLVSTVGRAHGWDVTVTESDAGGARIEFTF